MKKIIYAAMLLLGLSIMNSCSQNKLKGYEWLEGEWVHDSYPEAAAIFTPKYAQMVSLNFDEEEMNVFSAPKENFSISIEENSFLGDLKCIKTESGKYFYIDDAKQSLFLVYDFDQKAYFVKK